MSVRGKLRREEGAAAVEFALIVGLLAILIFGLLEYGLAFWQVQNLRAAAREGARVAAVRGDDTAVRDAMEEAAVGSLNGSWTFTRSRTCDDTQPNLGQEVTITINNASLPGSVQEAFRVNIPFIPLITVNPTLSGTFRCE
ncbi:MAG TPA: TadE/TadG family type IV pilus assembly protein [Actinomycetota bacterium]|nr:TadE/TadG family type IV pilus assembly protein [Actinomycetota bacterium]